jgi:hypothetical protein
LVQEHHLSVLSSPEKQRLGNPDKLFNFALYQGFLFAILLIKKGKSSGSFKFYLSKSLSRKEVLKALQGSTPASQFSTHTIEIFGSLVD